MEKNSQKQVQTKFYKIKKKKKKTLVSMLNTYRRV